MLLNRLQFNDFYVKTIRLSQSSVDKTTAPSFVLKWKVKLPASRYYLEGTALRRNDELASK